VFACAGCNAIWLVHFAQYVLTVLVCMAGVLLLRLVYTSWFFSNLVIDYTMFRSMVRLARFNFVVLKVF
jgi:hypothetical protein